MNIEICFRIELHCIPSICYINYTNWQQHQLNIIAKLAGVKVCISHDVLAKRLHATVLCFVNNRLLCSKVKQLSTCIGKPF